VSGLAILLRFGAQTTSSLAQGTHTPSSLRCYAPEKRASSHWIIARSLIPSPRAKQSKILKARGAAKGLVERCL